ncbi:hypothetical protein D3C72_1613570 [compost metagenome]
MILAFSLAASGRYWAETVNPPGLLQASTTEPARPFSAMTVPVGRTQQATGTVARSL